ncbi:MAG: OmpA family protein [Rubrivivax sp.]|nr:OmpA family protein [Rubrivivax sp.]
MLDELDDGARIGVWTALGVVALLLFGLLGGIAMKTLADRKAPAAMASGAPAAPRPVAPAAPAVAAPATAPAAPGADDVIDVPLAGQLVGTLYFDSGVAALGAEATQALKALTAEVQAASPRKVILSGFHDATGDPAKNAELAKERAKAVREALKAAGVAADRIALRKPESTTGDGTNKEARRVELRLFP